jgi:hypothetical protein
MTASSAEVLARRLERLERARRRDGRLLVLAVVAGAGLLLSASGHAPSANAPDGSQSRAISIVAGGNHTCALLSNGSVYCWGSNEYGQLGTGTTRFNDPTGRGRCLSPHIQPGVYAPAESSPMIDCAGRPARVQLP